MLVYKTPVMCDLSLSWNAETILELSKGLPAGASKLIVIILMKVWIQNAAQVIAIIIAKAVNSLSNHYNQYNSAFNTELLLCLICCLVSDTISRWLIKALQNHNCNLILWIYVLYHNTQQIVRPSSVPPPVQKSTRTIGISTCMWKSWTAPSAVRYLNIRAGSSFITPGQAFKTTT